jgi:predicted nucleotidyltransferase
MSWEYNRGEGLYYEDIFRKLQEKKIAYILIGGIAVNLWGIERATGDIDLALAMDRANIHEFAHAMKELGMLPKVPADPEELADPEKLKEWKETKNMKVFSFIHPDNPFVLIDVMINNPLDFKEMYSRRVIFKSKGVELSVAAVDDLIALKREAGREQDLSDIAALKKFVKGE